MFSGIDTLSSLLSHSKSSIENLPLIENVGQSSTVAYEDQTSPRYEFLEFGSPGFF